MLGHLLLLFPRGWDEALEKDYQMHERAKASLRNTPDGYLHGVIREYGETPWYQRWFSRRVELELGCLARAAEEILQERLQEKAYHQEP
jgi:hypothetical protein